MRPAQSDRRGRYAYQHQPLIATWNLSRLASCLLLVHDDQQAFEAVLNGFHGIYEGHYHSAMADKLGIDAFDADDVALLEDWLELLESEERDYSLSFRQLSARVADDGQKEFGEFEARWRGRVLRSGRSTEAIASAMNSVNPWVIPRNHQVERAIEDAVDGDLDVFHALRDVLSRPYEAQEGREEFAKPPRTEERVTQTFCGT